MSFIRGGSATVLYLFDVAESIALGARRAQLGPRASAARLGDKAPGSSRAQCSQPPLIVDGEVLALAELDGFRVRVKFYDYGVVPLTLTRPFAGSWADLVTLGQALIESEPLEAHAVAACQRIVGAVGGALVEQRTSFLGEDYLLFAVTSNW